MAKTSSSRGKRQKAFLCGPCLRAKGSSKGSRLYSPYPRTRTGNAPSYVAKSTFLAPYFPSYLPTFLPSLRPHPAVPHLVARRAAEVVGGAAAVEGRGAPARVAAAVGGRPRPVAGRARLRRRGPDQVAARPPGRVERDARAPADGRVRAPRPRGRPRVPRALPVPVELLQIHSSSFRRFVMNWIV